MPCGSSARRSPRLAITVVAIASPRSRPARVQVERGDREDVVAVDDAALLVDRDHAVRVAVEREPGVGAAPRRTARDEPARVGRAAAGR